MARTNWRHITPTTSRHAGAASEDLIRIDRIELELIRKGVPSESSGTLARQVERQLRGIPEDAAGLVLDGVALAFKLGVVKRQSAVGGEREARVVDRLLADFGNELQKLDESVKVLSAYLRRLRNPEPQSPRRHLQ